MRGDALRRMLAELAAQDWQPSTYGDGSARSRCPAHGGTDRNLSVRQGDHGVVMRCHSHGCGALDVAAALGLEPRLLFDAAWGRDEPAPRRRSLRCSACGQWPAAVRAGATPTEVERAGLSEDWLEHTAVRRRQAEHAERLIQAVQRISASAQLAAELDDGPRLARALRVLEEDER